MTAEDPPARFDTMDPKRGQCGQSEELLPFTRGRVLLTLLTIEKAPAER
jgi:hypothetical protein